MSPMSLPHLCPHAADDLVVRQGMCRRATAAAHERHAPVLAIHFIMKVFPVHPEKADNKGHKAGRRDDGMDLTGPGQGT